MHSTVERTKQTSWTTVPTPVRQRELCPHGHRGGDILSGSVKGHDTAAAKRLAHHLDSDLDVVDRLYRTHTPTVGSMWSAFRAARP